MSDSKNNLDNLSIDDLADEVESSVTSESPMMNLSAEESQAILRELSGDKKWTALQSMMIDIYADGKLKMAEGQRFPTGRELQELLKRKIETEYSDNIKFRTGLLNCVPTVRTLHRWAKLEGWNEDVMKKLKAEHLYSPEDRASIIIALKKEAQKGDVMAAKMVLTMTGDYDEKGQVSDEKFNTWQKYVNAMGRKKPDDKK